MRKLLIVAAITLLTGAALVSTLPQAALAKAGVQRMQKMAQALNLTDAQKAQIKPIVKAARQQAQAVKQDTSLSAGARKARMQAIRRSTWSQILPLLTPDQKQKLAQMRRGRQDNATNP